MDPSQAINYLPHLQHQEQTDILCLNEEQLVQSLFKYYVQLRSDALPSLSSTLPEQFSKIQKEVVSVVQLRKDMQKSLQIEAIQSQHFTTIAILLEEKLKTQHQIDQLATQVKQLESSHMKALLSIQQQQNKTNNKNENQILIQGHQLANQLTDFRRAVCLLTPNNDYPHSFEFQAKAKAEEEHIQQIFNEQRQKWNYTKLIYGIKFNQLTLRQELIDERQTAFREYERSNSELIEVLLREKERDKNLRKKDKQKFQEMLKMRHEIDIENEELSHSQRTLNSHYEVELLRMKDELHQQLERHREEVQRLNEKVQRLQKELTQRRREKEEKQLGMQDKQLKLMEDEVKLRSEIVLLNEKKKQFQFDLAAQITKNQLLTHESQTIQRQKVQLQLIIDKLTNKNQELLTQFNEAILKNSQNSQIKTQLNQKLESNTKTIQQLNVSIDKYKKQLTTIKSQHQNAQLQISTLQNKIKEQQIKLSHSANEIAKNNEYISQYDSKFTYLENQLTDNFIAHNQQTKAFQKELLKKSQLITLLTQQLDNCSRPIIFTEPTSVSLEPSVLQTLKSEVIAELQRSDHIKNTMIDEMVQRLSQMII